MIIVVVVIIILLLSLVIVHRLQWFCSHCKSPYSRDDIEQNLVEAVQRRSMSFVLQDLVCVKCNGVGYSYNVQL